MSDLSPLLFPPKKPWLSVRLIDLLSWALPLTAAALAIGGGIEAARGANLCAAQLSIAGGGASAFGIIFANWASLIRDQRLEEAKGLGQLGVDMADLAQRLNPFD